MDGPLYVFAVGNVPFEVAPVALVFKVPLVFEYSKTIMAICAPELVGVHVKV